MNRKNKAVSFNTGDPHELALVEHAERVNPLTGKPQNFSKYVKRLIEEDMKKEQSGNHPTGYTIIDSPKFNEDEDYTLEVKSAMNSFL
ncbi:hypothetical protein [Solibacillus daqui]|uniref:hypothetical protein n=1 Tax=Solibacillus daqui TaxID=2912187 RepID=UPI0023668473|nr:hypothetical protein [Solibacillus daqui]